MSRLDAYLLPNVFFCFVHTTFFLTNSTAAAGTRWHPRGEPLIQRSSAPLYMDVCCPEDICSSRLGEKAYCFTLILASLNHLSEVLAERDSGRVDPCVFHFKDVRLMHSSSIYLHRLCLFQVTKHQRLRFIFSTF